MIYVVFDREHDAQIQYILELPPGTDYIKASDLITEHLCLEFGMDKYNLWENFNWMPLDMNEVENRVII